MYHFLYNKILNLLHQQVPATGIGLFRLLYGLVTLQEICFLYYFNHLIFDPIPYIDVEYPGIPLFLCLWGVVACCVTVGYRYQFSVVANYLFWIVFVNFTSMQRDFDGGFDTFMIGVGFFLMFMPGNRALSVDRLRLKLSQPFVHYRVYPPSTVSLLSYHWPIIVCLGWLYLDSDIHKCFAEHWRNGLGTWLPATQPYYVSALDTSVLLNIEYLQKVIGYTIMLFQCTFVFFYANRYLRVLYLVFGISLHLGITLTLNIYPFGISMLIFYVLLVPSHWWSALASVCKAQQPSMTVFYDEDCPLCNRAILTLNHFDLFNRIDFKGAQTYSKHFPTIAAIGMDTLLSDLYGLDKQGKIYLGVETYRQILINMGYLTLIGYVMGLPGIRQFAQQKYRAIADSRQRYKKCDQECLRVATLEDSTLYSRIIESYGRQKPKALSSKLAKIGIILLVLQINSTLHYAIFYRMPIDYRQWSISKPLSQASNALLMLSGTFLGITPHALYLHDHFAGYDRILAITYIDKAGKEQWLPFVNQQGRLLAPNWGRVHSMWANIAVTPIINNTRLRKFIRKVTAFWGTEIGLELDDQIFTIKMKKIDAPTHWVFDQLRKNFASEWVTIGTARWLNKEIGYDLPADINSL